MIFTTIQVTGVRARTIFRDRIPAGIIGAQVRFEFDSSWDGLAKTVVFRGCVTKDVLMDGDVVTIPAEAVAHPIPELQIGVYGVNTEGTVAIPTLWAEAGRVHYATDPSGDTSTDESLPIWAQLQAELEKLKQDDSVNEATVQRIVADYLEENPPASGADGKDGQDGQDGYTPVKGTDYFTEADKNEMVSEVVETIEANSEVLKLTSEEVEALRGLLEPYTLKCAPVMSLTQNSGSTSGTRWYSVKITITGISKSLIQKVEATYGMRNPSNTSQIAYSSYSEVTGTYNDSTETYTATHKINYSGSSYFAGFKVRLTYTHPVDGTKTLERTV